MDIFENPDEFLADHTPGDCLDVALDNLIFIGKYKGLEHSRPYEMALLQIKTARKKLMLAENSRLELSE